MTYAWLLIGAIALIAIVAIAEAILRRGRYSPLSRGQPKAKRSNALGMEEIDMVEFNRTLAENEARAKCSGTDAHQSATETETARHRSRD